MNTFQQNKKKMEEHQIDISCLPKNCIIEFTFLYFSKRLLLRTIEARVCYEMP